MAGLVGYNPYTDAGNTIGGAGDILGSAILRGAMMRQQAAQRQQELMLEIERLRMQKEESKNLNKYREGELDLSRKSGEREDTRLGFEKQRSSIEKQKADDSATEMAIRQRFGKAARTQGLPPMVNPFGAPTLAGVKEYDEQKRQADLNEGMAFLSNDPSRAMEGIARQAALRNVGDNPVIQELLATGMNLHNAPAGNTVFSPGGSVVGQGQPRPVPGQTLSYNSGASLLDALMKQTGDGSVPNTELGQALNALILQGLRERLGTNMPPAQTQQGPVHVSSKAEYDKLPSGTQYIGPDGKLATKK